MSCGDVFIVKQYLGEATLPDTIKVSNPAETQPFSVYTRGMQTASIGFA